MIELEKVRYAVRHAGMKDGKPTNLVVSVPIEAVRVAGVEAGDRMRVDAMIEGDELVVTYRAKVKRPAAVA